MLLQLLKKYKIILGSASPRRSELLRGLNIAFEVMPMSVDENFPSKLTADEIPIFLAKAKSQAFDLDENSLLITADTIVSMNGVVYGKPSDAKAAKKMLKELSGKRHQVITGVCLRTTEREKCFSVSTKVDFADLSDDEIEFYIEHFRPYDKAGAYGIQEWIGYIGVKRIEGSYFNVMGLPVQRLFRELKNWDEKETVERS